MPKKALTSCNEFGCGKLTRRGYCDEHHQTKRKTAAAGYGSRWQRASRAHKSCNPLCVVCEAKGRVKLVDVTDHIIPHGDDYNLMWDESNWQSLCFACHATKTRLEQRGSN